MRPLRIAALAAVLALVTGCDSAQTFDPAPLAGTYAGTRVITDPDGTVDSDPVTVRTSVDEVAGTLTITIDGEPLEGTYDESGATFGAMDDVATLSFTLSPDGEIDGEGRFDIPESFGADLDVSGLWTAERFEFDLRVVYTEASEGSGVSVGDVALSETRATRR